MRTLFLDIDGVLNTNQFLASSIRNDNDRSRMDMFRCYIDTTTISRLNTITNSINAQIVVSSSWRYLFTLEDFQNQLRNLGVNAPIVGMTEIIAGPRGIEIQDYMTRNNIQHNEVIILDDNSDMEHLNDRLIQTSINEGLLDCHILQAIELFE